MHALSAETICARKHCRIVVGVGALLLTTAFSIAEAQTWRSLKIDRVVGDSTPLAVNVTFGEGVFEIRRSEEQSVYSMLLRYDAERVNPRHRYDSTSRTLSIGTEKLGGRMRFAADEMGDALLHLPPNVAANVSLDIAAASSTLEMGGLSLRTLHFRTGASQTIMKFSEPNSGPMSQLSIDGSAGSVKASGLANSRAPRIEVQAHLGAIDLDFGGDWLGGGDIVTDLRIVLATAVLRVPRDVGIEIHASSVLSSFSPEGFTRTGDVFRSSNWEASTRKLTVHSHAVLGRLSIVRTAPTL